MCGKRPHINSKIHVWKKTHGTLVTMLSRSGIGWNESTKTIEATDETWEAFVKTDRSMRAMRYKSWTYFPDWCESFGYDRATGQRSQTFTQAVQHVLKMSDEPVDEMDIGLEDMMRSFEGAGESMSVTKDYSVTIDTSLTMPEIRKAGSRKRKQPTQGEKLFVEAIKNFTYMTRQAIADLGKCLSDDYEISVPKSKDVIDELKRVLSLSRYDYCC
ncbi:hypothetical protein F511_25951 [Dorcoceras hygrometricum]|uniref:Uncharacterized protein n=1 Tax=Dorcoceras hygrometricum TaxID=472368 RepID=A0A2Z7AHD3_9LAMI|nr:hypothetical protein F511_25951 [Dorcoceras hygrometricum]